MQKRTNFIHFNIGIKVDGSKFEDTLFLNRVKISGIKNKFSPILLFTMEIGYSIDLMIKASWTRVLTCVTFLLIFDIKFTLFTFAFFIVGNAQIVEIFFVFYF